MHNSDLLCIILMPHKSVVFVMENEPMDVVTNRIMLEKVTKRCVM